MKKIILQQFGDTGNRFQSEIDAPPGSILSFNSRGELGSGVVGEETSSRLVSKTEFELLPAAAVAVSTDLLTLVAGVGTTVITRAAKGGVNLQTQASTPAQDDQSFIKAVTLSALRLAITATNTIKFATRVEFPVITVMAASIGLSELVTDVDPTATAGEGALFLFDPDSTVTTGLTVAQHANWILAHKVNGVDTFTATTIPVNAAQGYDLRVEIGTDLKAIFYINDVAAGTGPALTAADSVSVFGGVRTEEAVQKDIAIRFVRLSRAIA